MHGSRQDFLCSLFIAFLAITMAGSAAAQDTPPVLAAPLKPLEAPARPKPAAPPAQSAPSAQSAAVPPAAVAAPGAVAQPLSAAKLDQLVAPVALYPDPL